MNKLFFDLETTGTNSYSCEIITGYFMLLDESDNFICDYELYSQVNKWNNDAESIHGISESLMRSYPAKRVALDEFCEYLSSLPPFDAYLYANPNTEHGFLYYDVACIQMELMNHLCVDRLELQPFKAQNIASVYTMAKEAAKAGYFELNKKENNRSDFSQSGVYSALFNEEYKAHDAKEDVNSMIRIYNELEYRKNNGVINRNQLELI